MSEARPYLNWSLNELLEAFENNGDSIEALKSIHGELKHRSTRAAIQLESKVYTTIAELILLDTLEIGPRNHRRKAATKAPRPKILDQIPNMKMSQLMKLWNNAVRLSTRPEKQAEANAVIAEIENEWRRRDARPPCPEDFFDWPNTKAVGGDGSLTTEGWVRDGVLSYMGYRVGNSDGVATNIRERILALVFGGTLPPVFEPQYLKEWGEPGTALRLRKMAETLAALSRNAKRKRSSQMSAAVKSWEADLSFLYQIFYIDRFNFAWPSSEL